MLLKFTIINCRIGIESKKKMKKNNLTSQNFK